MSDRAKGWAFAIGYSVAFWTVVFTGVYCMAHFMWGWL